MMAAGVRGGAALPHVLPAHRLRRHRADRHRRARAPGDPGKIVTVRFDANVSAQARLDVRARGRRRSASRSARARWPSSTRPTSRTSRSPARRRSTSRPTRARAIFRQDPVLLLHPSRRCSRGETQRMPVVFYVDPAFLKDPDANGASARSRFPTHSTRWTAGRRQLRLRQTGQMTEPAEEGGNHGRREEPRISYPAAEPLADDRRLFGADAGLRRHHVHARRRLRRLSCSLGFAIGVLFTHGYAGGRT